MDSSIEVRGLEPSEISVWAEFCAFCFAHKRPCPPPASHFEGHYDNDPCRDASLVRVAMYKTHNADGSPTDAMVSSVRIFVRSITNMSKMKKLNVGGIGEVCTHTDFRRRGIASRLLQDAIGKMKERKMNFSLLHVSNPSLQVVYQKQGFVSVRSRWSAIPLFLLANKWDLPKIEEKDLFKVRLANFNNDEEVAQMHKIHKTYSEERFVGCIERSIDYWKEYLSKELENQLFVLECSKDNQTPNVCAWISIRKRGEKYQIREFGVDKDNTETYVAMAKLLPAVLSSAGIDVRKENEASKGIEYITLHMPSPVLKEIQGFSKACTFLDWTNVNEADDCGWFYKNLSEAPSANTFLKEISENVPHLIWPSDSF